MADPLPLGSVTKITDPLTVSVSHLESMAFYLISSPELPLIVGHTWLTCHNPHINWLSGEVLSWGSLCQDSCLKSHRITPEDLKSLDLSRVPSEYHHVQSVLCKERATVLPPHRSYDCAVELLPGACPPQGHIFSLYSPEQKAMEVCFCLPQ